MQLIENLTTFLILGVAGLVILLFIFLLLRYFILWYFRLGEIADDIHTIAEYYRRQDPQP